MIVFTFFRLRRHRRAAFHFSLAAVLIVCIGSQHAVLAQTSDSETEEGYAAPASDLRPDNDVSDDTGKTAAQAVAEHQANNKTGGLGRAEVQPAPEGLGGPVGNADGQPAGALSGVVVFCNAGHGWTAGTSSWILQRPLLLDMVEDYGNLDQLNYIVNYLYNAGAVVVPFRPVGQQPIEIVLDNDDPGVSFTGSWSNSATSSAYYENGVTASGIPYKYATAGASETATARYTPTVGTAGFYPVYCWTKDDTDRVVQTYRIKHSGGTAAVKIDHQRVGRGWMWLGTFHFDVGAAGYVEISNQSTGSGIVIADAIRLGNGIGDVVGAGPGTVSGFTREEECARYWAESEAGLNAVGMPSSIWNCCTLDQDDNVGTASRWSREMNRTNINNDRWRRLYIEAHSNAAGCGTSTCGAKGTVCLVSVSAPTTNQAAFATILGDKLETDMLAIDNQFEFLWGARTNPYFGEFGAISTNGNSDEFDATIMEYAFHDNTEDAANLLSAKVRDALARSTVQGIVQFLSDTSIFPTTQVPAVFLPDPPERVQAKHNGSGGIAVSWIAPPAGPAAGSSPAGYKVYRSGNGYGFGQAVDAGNTLTTTLNDIPAGTTTYLRVAAYNAGGESMPSEVLAVRRPASGQSRVLIVNGYDRVSRQQNVIQNIPAGPMQRPIARRVNAFDYIVQHAAALAANNVTFDACANEAVIAGAIQLSPYNAAVWILGEESSADKTFDSTEQTLVTNYLNGGGNLFATGAEIAYELDSLNAGRTFYRSVLGANYVGDSANTSSVTGNGGIMAGLGNFDFAVASGAPYTVEFPDRIAPQAGAAAMMTYVGGTADTAAVQFAAPNYRVVLFGFPFECITSAAIRNSIMQRVMDYFSALAPKPDFDHDGDVDLADFGHFQICMSGLNVEQNDPACLDARLDLDTDVDQGDFNIILGCLSGPNVPANPGCTQ